MRNNLVEKFFNQSNRKTKLLISLSVIGLVLFMGISLTFPLKDLVLSLLFPKPLSLASQRFGNSEVSPYPLDFGIISQSQPTITKELVIKNLGSTPSALPTPDWGYSNKEGRALSFNGQDSYVDLGTPQALEALLVSDFTISLWINPTPKANQNSVILARGDSFSSQQNKFILIYLDQGKLTASLRGDNGEKNSTSISSPTTIPPNSWTNITLVRKRATSLGMVGMVKKTPLSPRGADSASSLQAVLSATTSASPSAELGTGSSSTVSPSPTPSPLPSPTLFPSLSPTPTLSPSPSPSSTSELVLFINGKEEGRVKDNSGTITFVREKGLRPLSLGTAFLTLDPAQNHPSYQGLMDDLLIFKKALSLEEITGLSNLTSPTTIVDTLTSYLLGYFKFDDPSASSGQGGQGNTLNDSSSYGHQGQVKGSASFLDGRITIPTPIVFNTTSNNTSNTTSNTTSPYLRMDPHPSLDKMLKDSFTISGWAKYQGSGNKILVGKGDTYAGEQNKFILIYLDQEGKLVASLRGDNGEKNTTSLFGKTSIKAGEWFHYSLVRQKNVSLTLYLNGLADSDSIPDQAGDLTFTKDRPFTLGAANVGSSTGVTSSLFQGLMDDIRVYNQALTLNQIKDLYQQKVSLSNQSAYPKSPNLPHPQPLPPIPSTYTLSLKTPTPGYTLTISPSIFTLLPQKPQTITLTLKPDPQTLKEGSYSNELILNIDNQNYSIPLSFNYSIPIIDKIGFIPGGLSRFFGRQEERTEESAEDFARNFTAAFGLTKGSPKYDSRYDRNNDGRISLTDYPLPFLGAANKDNSEKNKKHKGFIVELRSKSLAEYAGEVKAKGLVSEYKEIVRLEHENAKKDILTLLNKRSVSSVGDLNSQDTKIKEDSLILLREYTIVLNGFALDVTDEEAEKLKKSSYVKRITPNYEVKATLDTSVPLIMAPDVWQIPDPGRVGRNVTGFGTKIAVIDSGIDYTHSALGSCTTNQFLNGRCVKVVGGYDFVNEDQDPMDDYGHGTHVASIAAGNEVVFKGVAPDAGLVAYKVLDAEGGGYDDAIIAAIERSIDPNQDGDTADHLDVINMSLGGPGDPGDPMSQAVDRAADAGTVMVVSAGNSGSDEHTIGSPGVANKALTVGANDDNRAIADFSSRGPVDSMIGLDNETIKPNVVAPGANICAARWDNALERRECGDNRHVYTSGTSMAAPHVAGVAALLKQLYPNWTPLEVKAALMTTAQDLEVSAITQGSGMINALRSAQITSLVIPPSLSFGFVDWSSGNVTMRKHLIIKNLRNGTADYSFRISQQISGTSVTFSPTSISLNPGESGEIQVDLGIDHGVLGEGLYFSEIQLVENNSTIYRIPFSFSKKAIRIILDREVAGGQFFAKVVTPYVGLSHAPNLILTSPSDQRVIPLTRVRLDPTLWESDGVSVAATGNYQLIATTSAMPGYRATASITIDRNPPTFRIEAQPGSGRIDIRVDPSKTIREPFYKTFIDRKSGLGNNYNPSLRVNGDNIYTVYQRYGDEGNRIYFIKSSDKGASWSRPVALAEFPGNRDFVFSSIAKLGNRIFVMFLDGSWNSRSSTLKIVSSDDGITWSTPQVVATNVNKRESGVFAFRGGNDNKLHAVYAGQKEIDREGRVLRSLYYIESSDGASWSVPHWITDVYSNTSIDMDIENGVFRVVYIKNRDSMLPSDESVVYYARSTNGTNWQIRELFRSARDNIMYPSMIRGGDDIYVAFGTNDSTGIFVKLLKFNDRDNNVVVRHNITQDRISVAPVLGYAVGKLYVAWTHFGYPAMSTGIRQSSDSGESWSDNLLNDRNNFFFAGVSTDELAVYFNWPSRESSEGQFRIAFARSTNLVGNLRYGGTLVEIVDLARLSNSWVGRAAWRGDGRYIVEVVGMDLAGNTGHSERSFNLTQNSLPLSLKLQGIGTGTGENRNPQRGDRVTTVKVFDSDRRQVSTASAALRFDGNNFVGQVNLGSIGVGSTSPSYYLTAKVDNSLSKLLNNGQPLNLSPTPIATQSATLIMGDVNNDNVINISDFGLLRPCFFKNTSSPDWSTCQAADFNDDGRITVTDYSRLITNFGRRGE